MEAIRNEQSKVWHLVGQRGCRAEPEGATVEGNWAGCETALTAIRATDALDVTSRFLDLQYIVGAAR